MRMSDLIKIQYAGKPKRRDAVYLLDKKYSNDSGLQMRRLITEGRSFTDEKNSAEKLYNAYLEQVKKIFNRAAIDFNIMPPAGPLKTMIKDLIDRLQLRDVDIMGLFMRHEEGDYIFSHSVNVTFLSVMLGVWLNYNMSDLNNLAIAALFHDIGMIRFNDISSLPKRLSQDERKQIDTHSSISSQFVEHISDIGKSAVEAILVHHMRLDSYNVNISEHAQIIGLADSLEAMTHPRAYKSMVQPHAAVRAIIENMRGQFNQSVIKALVDNIGIYPPGTWVILDTDEIGLVIDTNSGSPLSPKINIMFDKNIERLPNPRIADLSKKTHIHIIKPVEDEAKDRLKKALS